MIMTRNVAIKIGTTGLSLKDADAQPHRITEIYAIALEDGVETGEVFHCTINPQREMEPQTQKNNRIDQDTLKQSPVFSEILIDLIDFIEDSTPIFYSPHFQRQFLSQELELLPPDSKSQLSNTQTANLNKLLAKGNFINVGQQVKQQHPDLLNHQMQTIAEHYQVDYRYKSIKRCDPQIDCQTLVRVYQKLSDIEPQAEQKLSDYLASQHLFFSPNSTTTTAEKAEQPALSF